MPGRADRELTAAEHYRLDVGPITAGHHRTGLLRTASGMVCGRDRGPPARARAALAGTDVPIDKILAPLGVQRLDRRGLCRHGCLDTADGDVAVQLDRPSAESAALAPGASVAVSLPDQPVLVTPRRAG